MMQASQLKKSYPMLNPANITGRFICIVIFAGSLGGCVIAPEELAQLDANYQHPVVVKHYKRSEIQTVLPARRAIAQQVNVENQPHPNNARKVKKKAKGVAKQKLVKIRKQEGCVEPSTFDKVAKVKVKRSF